MKNQLTDRLIDRLPGLNCGSCGYRLCDEFAEFLKENPQEIKRCIHLSNNRLDPPATLKIPSPPSIAASCSTCSSSCGSASPSAPMNTIGELSWVDSLGRDFDFYLENLPEDIGPREIILPHNPMMTRELDVKVGDVLIGRPLGMSCGCPVTHCGVAIAVESKTGVITWCVTGPLRPRAEGFKDLGYYSAEAYEGLVKASRQELRIGMRYFFQPHLCMLQWRHSGLVNYINKTTGGMRIRVEGLFIG